MHAPPTLTTIAPSSRGQNATSQDLIFTGTNFAGTNGAPFAGFVGFSGSGITVNSKTRDTSAQLTVNVTIAAAQPSLPAT